MALLCRALDIRHVSPYGECPVAKDPVVPRLQSVTTESKKITDRDVRREEPLNTAHRLEPTHLPFTPASELMRNLRSDIGSPYRDSSACSCHYYPLAPPTSVNLTVPPALLRHPPLRRFLSGPIMRTEGGAGWLFGLSGSKFAFALPSPRTPPPGEGMMRTSDSALPERTQVR